MQTPDSQQIVTRFFQALYRLKTDKKIRGKQTFTRAHNINRWNLNTLEKNPASNIFQPAWLTYLVTEYEVSPLWLLTGKGNFYTTPQNKETPPPSPTTIWKREKIMNLSMNLQSV